MEIYKKTIGFDAKSAFRCTATEKDAYRLNMAVATINKERTCLVFGEYDLKQHLNTIHFNI